MTIKHSRGSYPIRFGSLAEAIANLPDDCVLVTDQNLASTYEFLIGSRRAIVLPAGEATKSFEYYERCVRQLAVLGASRKTTLVAVGGGVIGDLAGFVAASYMRGIPYLQVPTSLLAMVDSSVGGKVAIDLPEGKNLVGAFWPPVSVDICVDTLKSLSSRHFVNGMAEVWKYGYIMDAPLVSELEADPIGPDDDCEELIRRCVRHKAAVVEADEFETNGLRATLNFGHTIGHAIERVTGYGPILHGEAIAIGMVVEAKLGEILGVTEPSTADRVRAGLGAQGLPTYHECLSDLDGIVAAMQTDKKAESGKLAFSLLTQVGHCKLVRNVESVAIGEAVTQL